MREGEAPCAPKSSLAGVRYRELPSSSGLVRYPLPRGSAPKTPAANTIRSQCSKKKAVQFIAVTAFLFLAQTPILFHQFAVFLCETL